MNKTKIEWCDYTINPVKGLCPMACPYCYARRMYKRFKWNPEIRYEPLSLYPIVDLEKPSRIFIGSTIELFGDWVRYEWLEDIFRIAEAFPQHTLIFLTKQPQNLVQWSPFPDNCWVGCSVTAYPPMIREAFKGIEPVEATVKFISFEPLQGMIFSSDNVIERYIEHSGVNWVIIGQQTPVRLATMPKIEWIREIVEACDKAKVPVFLKNNLMSLLKGCYGVNAPYWSKVVPDFPNMDKLRQEYPLC